MLTAGWEYWTDVDVRLSLHLTELAPLVRLEIGAVQLGPGCNVVHNDQLVLEGIWMGC
jgi:hypothetical protein